MWGDFKNRLDFDLIGALPCLKNLIILITSFASVEFLGDNWNLKENGLNAGPLNKSSMLGFNTWPVVLDNNAWLSTPAAAAARAVPYASETARALFLSLSI